MKSSTLRMSYPEEKPLLIVIIGPTCVGKTELSIDLADKFDGEIISADSRTFYRGLNIGTAKPTKDELSRVPHHLVDIADPDQIISLVVFQDLVDRSIHEISEKGHLPFLVGGTGQYIRSIIRNWSPPPFPPNPSLRIALERLAAQRGNIFLHQGLFLLDPEATQRIDPRNLRRTIRALEVIFSTGIRFSAQRSSNSPNYRLLIIGLTRSRQELYSRIDQRIEKMFASGFLDEVQHLLDAGISPQFPAMSAIGYQECIQVINGNITEEQAVQEIKRKTRIFVRRQSNWFKLNDPEITWFNLDYQTIREVESYIRKSLKI